jgi:hypothetical protein
VKLFDDTGSSSVIPTPDLTLGAGLESMKALTKAALYARVSADKQRIEGTIESQVAELKRQISALVLYCRLHIDSGIGSNRWLHGKPCGPWGYHHAHHSFCGPCCSGLVVK